MARSGTSGALTVVSPGVLVLLRGEMSPPFFFNDTATTEIYTLSLHDALPISSLLTPALSAMVEVQLTVCATVAQLKLAAGVTLLVRKPTCMNSGPVVVSDAGSWLTLASAST